MASTLNPLSIPLKMLATLKSQHHKPICHEAAPVYQDTTSHPSSNSKWRTSSTCSSSSRALEGSTLCRLKVSFPHMLLHHYFSICYGVSPIDERPLICPNRRPIDTQPNESNMAYKENTIHNENQDATFHHTEL